MICFFFNCFEFNCHLEAAVKYQSGNDIPTFPLSTSAFSLQSAELSGKRKQTFSQLIFSLFLSILHNIEQFFWFVFIIRQTSTISKLSPVVISCQADVSTSQSKQSDSTDYSNKWFQLNPLFSCSLNSIRLVCSSTQVPVHSFINTRCDGGLG